MKLTPSLKKKVTKDWKEFFPTLEIHKPMSLERRVGPLLIGIVLETKSGNDRYYPLFHVHNLSEVSPGISLMLWEPLRTSYGAADWIVAKMHEKKYKDAAEKMKKQAILPIEGNIHLNHLNLLLRDNWYNFRS